MTLLHLTSMEELIASGSFYQVGNLIKSAVLNHEIIDLSPLEPYFHYVDPTILGAYFAFSDEEVPSTIATYADSSVELRSILAGRELLSKARDGDISVLRDLESTVFEGKIPQILYYKAKLIAQVKDRDCTLFETYNELSRFDKTFTADVLGRFADLAFACGVKSGALLHGFCVECLNDFRQMAQLISQPVFKEISAFEAEADGFRVSVSQEEAENWQRCTAIMNYMLKQNVSDRTNLPYDHCLAELRCSDEDELELLLAEMSIRKLLKVSIDQIDRVVKVFWVKPMVLDEEGRQTVVDRLQEWETRIQQTMEVFEKVCMEELVV